jgi:hypothetical protein
MMGATRTRATRRMRSIDIVIKVGVKGVFSGWPAAGK